MQVLTGLIVSPVRLTEAALQPFINTQFFCWTMICMKCIGSHPPTPCLWRLPCDSIACRSWVQLISLPLPLQRHSSCGAGGPGPLLPNDQSARTLAALRLLGIDQSESKSAVRAAYVKKMKILHPDVNPDLDTTEEAIAIVAAYKHILAVSTLPQLTPVTHECLLDPRLA